MDINVSSEIGHLKGVIVHTPGHEVSLVNPELKDELLFDDIIFEEDAREEHLDMIKVFEAAIEAALALEPWFVPVDHTIIGIIDDIQLSPEIEQ